MPESTLKKQTTRFKPGMSGNPKGKPKGARSLSTRFAEAILAKDAEAVVRKVIEKAKDGDMGAAKMVLDRIAPIRKGVPVQFDLPSVTDAKSLVDASRRLLGAVCAGRVSPDEATAVLGLLEACRKAIETEELEDRIRKLEGREQ